MHRVVSKFVPRLLTQDQRESHVAICQELSNCASEDENFLKRIITGDETWVYGYDVQTKMQSSQWVGKTSPRPKKAQQVKSIVKVMLTGFFDTKGVVYHEFLRQEQTVNRWYHLEVLKHLRENVRRKRPQLCRNNFWFLHHDNAPAHAPLLICDFLANTNKTVLPQPPYSPDLLRQTFSCFPN
jgi:hypothetical protein